MSHEEKHEWPSFGAVLDDVTSRGISTRTSSGHDSEIGQPSDEAQPSFVGDRNWPGPVSKTEEAGTALTSELVPAPLSLPEPLAPLELDTKKVRELLRPSRPSTDLDLSALEALEPAEAIETESLEETQLLEADATFEDTEIETEELLEDTEVETEELFQDTEIETEELLEDTEIETEELLEDTEAETEELFQDTEIETEELQWSLDGETDAEVPPLVFEMSDSELLEHAQSDQLIEDSDALSSEDTSEELFSDPFPTEFPVGDAIATDPFSDLDDSLGITFTTPAGAAATPESDSDDLFADLTDPVETDNTEAVDEDAGAEVVGLFDERPDLVFDSVEVANEIEDDLFDLGEMTDNVVPLISGSEPAQESDSDSSSFDPETPLDQASTDWSSLIDEPEEEISPPVIGDQFDFSSETAATLNPDELARSPRWRGLGEPKIITDSEGDKDVKDEWAHMRPVEEPNDSWWANRPRFLGGRKKAPEKTPEEVEALLVAAGLSYKTSCPTCGVDGDLKNEDPLARQVHLSCSECDISWQTSYDIDAEAS